MSMKQGPHFMGMRPPAIAIGRRIDAHSMTSTSNEAAA